jgi:hypothetical protein
MPDFLKPYLSRVIATLIAGFVGFLASHQINVDGDTQAQAISAITSVVTVVFGILYAVFHKILDKWINPADGAAQANIAEGHVIKAASK